jgi:hypothetical protein
MLRVCQKKGASALAVSELDPFDKLTALAAV